MTFQLFLRGESVVSFYFEFNYLYYYMRNNIFIDYMEWICFKEVDH